MILVRSLIFQAFLLGSVVLFAVPIVLFGRLIPYPRLSRIGNAWGRLSLLGLKWICGLDYRVTGMEKLPSEPTIVLCKHQSAWETIALRALLPSEQTWVVKQELIRLPFFGWALARFDPIAIDRSQGRKAAGKLLEEGSKWLNEGRWIIIFPEGTRVTSGERHAYGIGGALLAAKTGRPVVPVAHNAGVYWARRSVLKYPGTIDLVIGDLIHTRGKKAIEIIREVENRIESEVAQLPATRPAHHGSEAP